MNLPKTGLIFLFSSLFFMKNKIKIILTSSKHEKVKKAFGVIRDGFLEFCTGSGIIILSLPNVQNEENETILEIL